MNSVTFGMSSEQTQGISPSRPKRRWVEAFNTATLPLKKRAIAPLETGPTEDAFQASPQTIPSQPKRRWVEAFNTATLPLKKRAIAPLETGPTEDAFQASPQTVLSRAKQKIRMR